MYRPKGFLRSNRLSELCSYKASIPGIIITISIGTFYIIRRHTLYLADGYIFLAYARQISSALNWGINAGEPSFATSSPLWTVICALFRLITPSWLDFVRVMQVVGLLLIAGALPIMDSILRRLKIPTIPRTLAIGIYAAIPFGGLFYEISAMETSLYILIFFCVVRVALSDPSPRMSALFGVITGLLFLVRIEGAMCMLSFALLIAISESAPSKKLLTLVTAGFTFICTILPWQIYLYLKGGILIPTSGTGRLYLYFPIKGLEISSYLALNMFQHLYLIWNIFQSNFIQHPVVLIFGFLPTAGTISVLILSRFRKIVSLSDLQKRAVLFLSVYCILNFILYMFFQPLIYQRYLVAALPSFLICLLTVTPFEGAIGKQFARSWTRMGMALASLGALIFINWFGLGYFDKSTRNDTQVIALFGRLKTSIGDTPCRLGAEPLGIAAYFTSCYIVDLGGLIDPDIWPYWIHSNRQHIDQATGQYAIDRHVDYLYSSNGLLPSNISDRFEPRYRGITPSIIYEAKVEMAKGRAAKPVEAGRQRPAQARQSAKARLD